MRAHFNSLFCSYLTLFPAPVRIAEKMLCKYDALCSLNINFGDISWPLQEYSTNHP